MSDEGAARRRGTCRPPRPIDRVTGLGSSHRNAWPTRSRRVVDAKTHAERRRSSRPPGTENHSRRSDDLAMCASAKSSVPARTMAPSRNEKRGCTNRSSAPPPLPALAVLALPRSRSRPPRGNRRQAAVGGSSSGAVPSSLSARLVVAAGAVERTDSAARGADGEAAGAGVPASAVADVGEVALPGAGPLPGVDPRPAIRQRVTRWLVQLPWSVPIATLASGGHVRGRYDLRENRHHREPKRTAAFRRRVQGAGRERPIDPPSASPQVDAERRVPVIDVAPRELRHGVGVRLRFDRGCIRIRRRARCSRRSRVVPGTRRENPAPIAGHPRGRRPPATMRITRITGSAVAPQSLHRAAIDRECRDVVVNVRNHFTDIRLRRPEPSCNDEQLIRALRVPVVVPVVTAALLIVSALSHAASTRVAARRQRRGRSGDDDDRDRRRRGTRHNERRRCARPARRRCDHARGYGLASSRGRVVTSLADPGPRPKDAAADAAPHVRHSSRSVAQPSAPPARRAAHASRTRIATSRAESAAARTPGGAWGWRCPKDSLLPDPHPLRALLSMQAAPRA